MFLVSKSHMAAYPPRDLAHFNWLCKLARCEYDSLIKHASRFCFVLFRIEFTVRAQRWHIIMLIFAAVFDLKIGKKMCIGAS